VHLQIKKPCMIELFYYNACLSTPNGFDALAEVMELYRRLEHPVHKRPLDSYHRFKTTFLRSWSAYFRGIEKRS